MKRKKIFLSFLNLLAVTTLPVVSLSACTNNSNPIINFTFSVPDSVMTTKREATIDLNWTPKDQGFTVSDVDFTYGVNKHAEIEKLTCTDQTQKLKLTFSEDILNEDIADGSLSFHYKSETYSKEGNYSVNNIVIYKYIIPFEEDDWSSVCNYANQGLDQLKQHYKVDSFVGKTKEIIVDDFKYEVQVIGENEDFLSDDEGKPQLDKPVALTFMFKTAIQLKDEYGYKPYWINFSTPSGAFEEDLWGNSLVRDILQKQFLPKLQLSLDNNVKTVSKNTICNFINGDVAAKSETLFLPSLADIFSSDMKTPQLPTVDYDIENRDAYIQEGRKYMEHGEEHYARYSYFDKIVEQSYNQQHQELAVYDGKDKEPNNEVSYWLRSCFPNLGAYLEDRLEWSWHSYTDDEEQAELSWMLFPREAASQKKDCGMAPIFCI